MKIFRQVALIFTYAPIINCISNVTLVKRVTVNIPIDMHKQLKIHAVMSDSSMNDLILEGIHLYLKGISTSSQKAELSPEE